MAPSPAEASDAHTPGTVIAPRLPSAAPAAPAAPTAPAVSAIPAARDHTGRDMRSEDPAGTRVTAAG
ncbi:hypothetical protein B1H18_15150 [Streptomyces tsukubensis]|uniref:Uncharacterized protein n=2 Tax=Streptomyces tsukubensis TaxID=83656 RepID=A0A1V4A8L7_9ACTN|nr:hypothetical protein B1H18_15150 [Streptomyces tsukubensis]